MTTENNWETQAQRLEDLINNDIGNVKNILKRAEETKNNIITKISALKSKINSNKLKQGEIATLQKEIAGLKENIEIKEKDIERFRTNETASNERLEKLQNELSTQQKNVNDKLTSLLSLLQSNQKDYDSINEQFEAITKEINNLVDNQGDDNEGEDPSGTRKKVDTETKLQTPQEAQKIREERKQKLKKSFGESFIKINLNEHNAADKKKIDHIYFRPSNNKLTYFYYDKEDKKIMDKIEKWNDKNSDLKITVKPPFDTGATIQKSRLEANSTNRTRTGLTPFEIGPEKGGKKKKTKRKAVKKRKTMKKKKNRR